MLFACLLITIGVVVLGGPPPGTTSLTVLNLAGAPVELFWKENDHHLVPQLDNPLRNGTEAKINSFATHQFVVRLQANGTTKENTFVKGKEDETFQVLYNSSTSEVQVALVNPFQSWEQALQQSEKQCAKLRGSALEDCVVNAVKHEVNHLTKSMQTLIKTTASVSHRLRNYTCADESLTTSPPLYSYPFRWKGRRHDVQVLLNHSHSHIWMIDNFISDEECAILERVGRPKLYRATVAAEDGTSVVSENRKAQQASYDSHLTLKEKDPLWDLQQRILSVTNAHTGLNLSHPGQESFTIIQYNPSDQYTPHCDGQCDFSPHVKFGRVATAVMYCIEPDQGGATTFTKVNLVVRPKKGAVTFFGYKGVDGRMDPGFTEHSGCPVLAGEKMIVTFWMRDGVSETEPSTKYDPMGLRIFDANDPDQN